jgi:hypothetical protein
MAFSLSHLTWSFTPLLKWYRYLRITSEIPEALKNFIPSYIATTGFMDWLISCAVFWISEMPFAIFWSLRLEVNPTTQIAATEGEAV